MADADGRIIPWLDEDQGEGVKDPIEELLEGFVEAGQKAEASIHEILAQKVAAIGEEITKREQEED
jgi:hypothetical protein